MRFPGRDYLLYAQDPWVRHDRGRHLASGLLRFLYTPGHDRAELEADLSYVSTAFADLDYEFVDAQGDEAISYSPAGTRVYPIWRLTRHDTLDLLELLDTHDRVYIHNPVPNQLLTNGGRPDLHHRLRELREIIDDNPSKQFIVFGCQQLQLYFCFGMAGGALRIRGAPRGGHRRGTVNPRDVTGRLMDRDEFESIDWSYSPFVSRGDLAGDYVYVAMELAKSIPLYLADYYANRDVIDTPDDLLEQVYASIAKSPVNQLFANPTGSGLSAGRLWFLPGDRIRCDHCSVGYACRIYREGSVCALPGSNEQRLSAFFGTRDWKTVRDGIGKILQFQADRFENAVELEDGRRRKHLDKYDVDDPDHPFRMDPEIGKMANDLQRNAKQYAILLNPAITRPQVAIGIVNNGDGSPRQIRVERADVPARLQAQAARELEAAGVPREEQTPEMIFSHLEKHHQLAIEGEVVEGGKDY